VEESGLPPADEENTAGQKSNRQDVRSLVEQQYLKQVMI